MLHFANYKKSYGRFTVLTIHDLTVPAGIYWIRGANGSGKSTLLKTIGGMLAFDGDIVLNNQSVKKDAIAFRSVVNFADAEPLFPEFLTGQEMIDVFVTAKQASDGQAEYFVDSMHMKNYLHQPLGTYSSGMLKKLSLVLAFLGNPTLILLDEPLITLDADSLTILYRWIAEKHRADGTMFFLSSHQEPDHVALPIDGEMKVENNRLTFPC
ncbi:ABC transporter ATP-binding protein [Chryseolinea lacunae]|uniref:ABC transporter ATP-binding protein n=1 Tax=Chryseolinea lacunae TaxID=2801331 RepID=A0ABS1KLR2_9BACT|nr:ATP-binding cassette domain-containing protein [Chryseolinea lacunae]MBL0740269.1 ABC transporter ATP-binding protein [Chryseolinea lacunae]